MPFDMHELIDEARRRRIVSSEIKPLYALVIVGFGRSTARPSHRANNPGSGRRVVVDRPTSARVS